MSSSEEVDELWDLFHKFNKSNTSHDQQQPRHRCINSICGSKDIDLDGSNYVCRKCGTLQDRFIDMAAEWRYFGNSDGKGCKDPARCGLPTNDLLPTSSMSTFIGMAGSSKYYKDVASISRYQMWNSMPYKERSLFCAIDHLTVRAINSGISQSIIDDAKVLFKRIHEKHISRGDNRTGLLASSIYIACKNHKVPRSAHEIAEMFGVKTTTITRNCKKFQEILHLKLACSTPADYVSRFCSQLPIDIKVKELCVHAVSKMQEYGLMTDNSPTSAVSGAIYLVCENEGLANEVTRKEVAKICGVSDVTVNKCYKKLLPFSEYLLVSPS